ncbi:MAG: helix-turn-helix domain-containing protein [Candidatus Dormibacteraceae bacterium]
MVDTENLGQRIRRIRHERGMSLAKVTGGHFSRAFLNQVEFGRVQPSTRVLRVIADRLGTDVNYLLEGREPALERDLALEKGRVLLARGEPAKALLALSPVLESTEWPIGSDSRLAQVQALIALGRGEEAAPIAAREKELITARGDRHRLERLRAIQRGESFAFAADAVKAHLRLADRAQRAANNRDALEHYRAARVLLEAGATAPR